MWHMFRAGPNDREGAYVSSFPSLDAARRVIEDITGDRKLVIRQNASGVQFIIKDHATTFESLAASVVYTVSRERRNPVMSPAEFKVGGRIIGPGEKLPPRYLRYLKVEP